MFMVCCDMQRHTQACESLRRPSGPRISVRSHQMAVFTGMAHERHSSREKLVYYSTPPGRSIRPAAITVRQVLLQLLTLTACCCTAISHTSVYSLVASKYNSAVPAAHVYHVAGKISNQSMEVWISHRAGRYRR